MALTQSDEERSFYVWVSPDDQLVRHNLAIVGSFEGGPSFGDDNPSRLPFQPNSVESGEVVSPFHNGITSRYRVEWWLDTARWSRYPLHPSRLYALFLLEDEETALAYAATHADHVAGRKLKRAVTVGSYRFSVHDSAWIDFMRQPYSFDNETIDNLCDAYWQGEHVENHPLILGSGPWTAKSVLEVLFYGRVDFPDRSLD